MGHERYFLEFRQCPLLSPTPSLENEGGWYPYVGEFVFAKLPCTGWSCCQGVCVRAPRTLEHVLLQPHQFPDSCRSVSAPPRMQEKQAGNMGCEEKSRTVHREMKGNKERKKLKLPKSSMLWSFNKTLFTSASWLTRFKRKPLKNKIFWFWR